MSLEDVQLKRVATVSYGLGQPPPLADAGVPILRATNIHRGKITSEDLIFAERDDLPLERAPLLQSGEVLVVRSGAYTGDSALVTPEWAGAAPGYDLRITAGSALDPRFLAFSLLGRRALDEIGLVSSRAAQPHLNAEELGELTVWCPSLSVQRAIADYLDAETARIDDLITAKRRMIDALDERVAVCTEEALRNAAVGEVRLRRLLLRPPEYGLSEPGLEGDPAWPRYIRITDITPGGQLRKEDVRRLPPELAKPRMMSDGDLLIARSGATVGKAFMYRAEFGPSSFAGYLIRFAVDPAMMLSELVVAWTATPHYWSQVREAALQATIENVSAEGYKDFVLPLVDRARQTSVLAAIRHQRDTVVNTTSSLRRQIELLAEHRRAVITAAVTGDLELPGVAA